MIGESISHYRILEKLSEGGRDIINMVGDLKLRKIIALKILSETLTKDEESKRRFISEVQPALFFRIIIFVQYEC